MKRLTLAAVALLGAAALGLLERDPASAPPLRADDVAAQLAEAFANRTSNLQVEGEGTVTKLLRDDLKGSRHQRFILEFPGEQTVLVAHNIDLAPRVEGLRVGDRVGFFGEYEWNDRGGVIHWTHHDPGGRHVDGWLKHGGKVYD